MQASIDELRDLSRRSRRTQRYAFLSLTSLWAAPALAWGMGLRGPLWVYLAFAAGGITVMGYAYLAGQERGAFRRVFRRIHDERVAARNARE